MYANIIDQSHNGIEAQDVNLIQRVSKLGILFTQLQGVVLQVNSMRNNVRKHTR